MEKHEVRKKICFGLIICIIALIFTYFTERIWYNRDIIIDCIKGVNSISESIQRFSFSSGLLTRKEISVMILFSIGYVFIAIHFIIPPKKIYEFLFSKRYIVGLLMLVFFVVNQYHGLSIANYNQIIQPQYTSEYSEPVLGFARAIRSDEWVVITPYTLSEQFEQTQFDDYDAIPRATKTPNDLKVSYATLATPLNFGYALFGIKYGASINWFGTWILTFLVSIDFLLILTRKRKLLSVAGAVLLTFSGYYLWWSQVQWILFAQASIVCGYHFLCNQERWKKVLFALGLGISFAGFVCLLYPAWQVPVGYLFLGIFVWVLVSNFEKIKAMKWIDWGIFALAIAFAGSIIVVHLLNTQEYNQIMAQTVYPGARFSTGGIDSDTLAKLFAFILTPMSVINKVLNTSEYSSMLTFFPVGLILSIYFIIRKREWKNHLLLIILIVYSLIIGSYVFIGWPDWLCKISFMYYSPGSRCVDIFNYSQLLLLIVLFSAWKDEDKLRPIWAGIIALGYCIFECFATISVYQGESISKKYFIIASLVLSIILFFMIVDLGTFNLNRKIFEKVMIVTSIGVLLFGVMVHPVQKGFDVIYEKPLAKYISSIISEDSNGKWLDVSGNIVSPQYLLACGAPTINSTNKIPNLELWNKLDSTGQYSDIYNRYSHVSVALTESPTSFELIQQDWIKLNLSINDIRTAEVKYIFYNGEECPETVFLDQHFRLIYRNQCSIYVVD